MKMEKKIDRINIELYPSVKNHLNQYLEKLKDRDKGNKGDTDYNLRDCAYYLEFEKEKIVWGRITQKPGFYITKKRYVCFK